VKDLQQQNWEFKRNCTCNRQAAPEPEPVEQDRRPSVVFDELLLENSTKKAAVVVDEFFKNIQVSQSRGTITASNERYILGKSTFD